MKHIPLLLFLLISLQAFTQNLTPQVFNYQAIARGSNGNPLPSQTISLRFTIHDVSQSGVIVFQETHFASTNQFGLFIDTIGAGTIVQGSFAGINWSTGNKYLQVELDPTGGTNYSDMGTTQMASVPYAQNSANAGNWYDYAVYDEKVASGNSPLTTLSDNTWTARQLNNTEDSAGSSISRNGSNITLVPGKYYVKAFGDFGLYALVNGNTPPINYTSGKGLLRLRNSTTSSTLVLSNGITELANLSGLNGDTVRADYSLNLDGTITVSAPTTLSLQQYVNSLVNATYGNYFDAGSPVNSGEDEIYSKILIQRIQ